MKYQRLSVLASLMAALLISASTLAADDGPSAELLFEWQQSLNQAASLQAEASTRQDAADEILAEKMAACFHKFQVNACRNEAKAEHTASVRVAKRLENEGKSLERKVKQAQLLDQDRRRALQAPQREAELQAHERETSALRQASEAEQVATRADKEKKAEEGGRRKALDAERVRQKQADHAARLAQKIKDSERRAAEAAARK